MRNTQADNKGGPYLSVHCVVLGRFNGDIVLSTVNEVAALGEFKGKIMTEFVRAEISTPKSIRLAGVCCENTAGSWENQCPQNWGARGAKSSNFALSLL